MNNHEWRQLCRALAMHSVLVNPPPVSIRVKSENAPPVPTREEEAETRAKLIEVFAIGDLNKPADPFT